MTSDHNTSLGATRDQGSEAVAVQCLRDEANAILGLIPQIDEQFTRVVDLLYACKGHVVVTGVGKSGNVGAKIAATLSSTGTPAIYINPLDALHGSLGMITANDVVLMLSHSGNTDELLRIIHALSERDIPIVSLTGNPTSLLARHSRHHICVGVSKEACPLDLAPTCSTTATIAMGDALAVALMERRHFSAGDFARLHPGGSLGQKLLLRAKDVMYKENLPVISPDMLLLDALIDISRGKLGLGVVMQGDTIRGIITDGDIRRAVEGQRNQFLSLRVEQVMTATPKTINPEARLTQVQAMFRKHKIHSLLVVDHERLVGIVDYFAIMN